MLSSELEQFAATLRRKVNSSLSLSVGGVILFVFVRNIRVALPARRWSRGTVHLQRTTCRKMKLEVIFMIASNFR